MKKLDHFLQNWRIRKATPWIRAGTDILDIGCGSGELFQQITVPIRSGLGIDPRLEETTWLNAQVQLISGTFPEDVPTGVAFDLIVGLAVMEHIPPEKVAGFIQACHRLLKPDGEVILTVPSPWVDPILEILIFFKLIEGMALDEHHGYQVKDTPRHFFAHDFTLLNASIFQLGLNNLFRFRKKG